MGSTSAHPRLSEESITKHQRPLVLRRLTSFILIVMLGAFLTACDEMDQRAVQPGIVVSSPTPALSASPEADENARGGAGIWTPGSTDLFPDRNHIYFTQGGDLWQIPQDGEPAPVIQDQDILAFSPSPDGEQVALVFQGEEETGERFAIVNADGSTAIELGLSTQNEGATPDEDGTPIPDIDGVRSIAWSPIGFSLAVAGRDGSITVVSGDGQVRQVVPPGEGSHPGELSWAPNGEVLAYLDPALAGEPTSLNLVNVETGSVRELVPGDDDRAVAAATWLPGRAALAYVLTSPSTIDRGGDVFAVDAASGAQQLLIPSGEFAPVAGAVNLSASPDGQYLALTVFVPGEERPKFQSLWIMNLDTRDLTKIETSPNEAVTDIWWQSGHSIFYRGILEPDARVTGLYTGMERFAIYQFDPDSEEAQERYRQAQ